jgi:hypothetical protein
VQYPFRVKPVSGSLEQISNFDCKMFLSFSITNI